MGGRVKEVVHCKERRKHFLHLPWSFISGKQQCDLCTVFIQCNESNRFKNQKRHYYLYLVAVYEHLNVPFALAADGIAQFWWVIWILGNATSWGYIGNRPHMFKLFMSLMSCYNQSISKASFVTQFDNFGNIILLSFIASDGSLPPFLWDYTMILLHPRIIVGDAGFEIWTSAP